MPGLRTKISVTAGLAASAASQRLGRGQGSVIGGRVALVLDPDALSHLAPGHRLVLVSGTNGKTTTTRLLAAALAQDGHPVAHNSGGANLPAGIVSALSQAEPGTVGTLEVDEAWLESVAEAITPQCVVLLNLSRDQLDRVSEVRNLGLRWRKAMGKSPSTVVVANADDPIVTWAALGSKQVRWIAAGQPWRGDASGCPACAGRIVYKGDDWWCDAACGLRKPVLDAWLEGDSLVTAGGESVRLDLAIPGRFNQANAAMAAVAAVEMGVPLALAVQAMSSIGAVQGRYEVVKLARRVGEPIGARLLLAKNPAGWVELFDLLAPAPAPLVLGINARIADGRDPSWLWDVPFEQLQGRFVVASGERWRDLSVRLHYAGVDHVAEVNPLRAIHIAAEGPLVKRAGIGSTSLGEEHAPTIDVIANYTSFQQFRRAVASRSAVVSAGGPGARTGSHAGSL